MLSMRAVAFMNTPVWLTTWVTQWPERTSFGLGEIPPELLELLLQLHILQFLLLAQHMLLELCHIVVNGIAPLVHQINALVGLLDLGQN
jgi:hypothetical protein